MKALIVDTETTGLLDFKKPADHDSQPRICQLSASLVDDDANLIESINFYMLPDKWPPEIRSPSHNQSAFAVNGLSIEKLEADGVPIEHALEEYDRLVTDCELLVGFSMAFDLKMIRGEQRRAGRADRYGEKPIFDVKPAIQKHLGVSSIKLENAVRQVLDREPTEAHTGHGDVIDTIALYAFCVERRLVLSRMEGAGK